MKRLWPLAALLVLAACGDKTADQSTQDAEVTETVMDNVDDLQGTISDDMITIDDIRSQAPTFDAGATAPAADAAANEGTSADGSPATDSGGDPATGSE